MLGASIIRHIRETASRFVSAKGGNVAVIFSIALVPLISFVGAAIDYSRATRARTSMQAALDSTALMLSKDLTSGTITADQVSAKAKTYFAALFTNTEAVLKSPISATYTANNGNLGSTIEINGSGSITTDFMNVIGFPTLSFSGASTIAWGNVKMRVALALDNTGSMSSDGKIAALRTAASNLVDQLSALAKNDGDVLISVIPFAKTVNVGSSNYGANWIDWTDWKNPPTSQLNNGSKQAVLPKNWHAVGPGSVCPFTDGTSGIGGFVCTTGPTNATSKSLSNNRNVIPSSGTYQGYICPSVDYNSNTLYNGCWTSVATNPPSAVFCSGDNSCACPLNSSGDPISGCSCNPSSGSSKSCTGLTYKHNWSQPGIVAYVGFTNNRWTPTTSTATVLNTWTATSSNPTSTWTGCITDRTRDYDTTSDAPISTDTKFPANQHYNRLGTAGYGTTSTYEAYCASNNSPLLLPVMPLTYVWKTLKDNIKVMAPTGNTNQSIGLAWAWQSLLQTGPIPAPAEDSNYTYNRVIILLSDGLNTENRWPNDDSGEIDARQALLCQNIKKPIDPKTNKPMYTIYTIQVNTSSPADATSSVLKNCATDADKFFQLTNANQIVTTFNTIGTSLSQLRVAR